MSKNLSNVLVGGGAGSAVYTGPKGATLPTTLAAPGVTIKEVGWLSPEGTSFAREEDRKVFRGHQGGAIVKRMTASVDDKFKFQCLETTALVLGLVFKGQTPTIATGIATIHVTNQAKSDDRCWVIDEELDDGSIERWCIPLGSAELTAEIARQTEELTVYEFTVGVTGDYDYITDAPGVIA